MKPRYRNIAFLMELMVNIVVFSVSCAILVGLFGKAWQLSRGTIEQTRAKTEVSSLVEVLRARGVESMAAAANNGAEPSTFAVGPSRYAFNIYYDGNWNLVSPGTGHSYRVELLVEDGPGEAGTLQRIWATAYSGAGEALYTLETAHYMPVF